MVNTFKWYRTILSAPLRESIARCWTQNQIFYLHAHELRTAKGEHNKSATMCPILLCPSKLCLCFRCYNAPSTTTDRPTLTGGGGGVGTRPRYWVVCQRGEGSRPGTGKASPQVSCSAHGTWSAESALNLQSQPLDVCHCRLGAGCCISEVSKGVIAQTGPGDLHNNRNQQRPLCHYKRHTFPQEDDDTISWNVVASIKLPFLLLQP